MAKVQDNTGNSGATASPAATNNATLPTGTTAGNTLLLIVAADQLVTTPTGFALDNSQVSTAAQYTFRKATTAGETSWAFTLSPAGPYCWYIREESGLTGSQDATAKSGSSTTALTRAVGPAPATGTLSQAAELALAAFATDNTGTPPNTSTTMTTFTKINDQVTSRTTTSTNVSLTVGELYTSSTAALSSTATWNVAKASTGIINTYPQSAATLPRAPVMVRQAVNRAANF